jgi:hypothetical protein
MPQSPQGHGLRELMAERGMELPKPAREWPGHDCLAEAQAAR